MLKKPTNFLFLVLLVLCSVANASELVDFNRDVRPILNQHCVACHGGVSQAADLSFVYEDQALSVIEPGQPADSVMFERVTSDDDDERMPPPDHGRALSDQELQTLSRWIEQGAKWGLHWAYEPPQMTKLPDAEADWGIGPIDHFVLARLRAAGLSPSPQAEPERWLRRVSLDLTGLPPTPSQREKFLGEIAECGEQAYAAAVDRLLQSPAFGERWASVWLDVVRYADSKGLGQDGRRTIWKYRDWVIRAFNSDLPFDQFTIQQIAGDELPDADIDTILATACQRLTQTNEEGGTDDEQFRVEAVIDRVNTTWQAWMGLSFGCVQCHSHPYEPIRHEEYYRFLAYFNNTADSDLSGDEPLLNVPVDPAQTQTANELDQQIKQLSYDDWAAADALISGQSNWTPLRALTASTNSSTQVVVAEVDGIEEVQTRGTVAKETTFIVTSPVPAELGQITAFRFTGLPENETTALADSEWGFVLSHVQIEILEPGMDEPVNLPIARVIADEPQPLQDPQQSLNAKSVGGAGAYSRIHKPRSVTFVLENARPLAPGSQLRISLSQNTFELGAFPLVAHRCRLDVSGSSEFQGWLHDESRVAARKELAHLKATRKQIASVSIPIFRQREAEHARPTHVFDRGNYLTKSQLVRPATPAFLNSKHDEASHKLVDAAEIEMGSRLQLAEWIASPENPLTSRVAVNRFWAQMFGVGLVETQEDFGSSGENPSHPELLDDLAARFSGEMGWSVKSLLREIALSATYRQSAATTRQTLAADPRNRLLSRGPRSRLPAETLRDQALAISGLLSSEQFGPPVFPPIPDGVWMPFQGGDKWVTPEPDNPNRYRRTIYTYTKRTIPFPMMAAFDAPSREFCAPRRLPSNTPLQALMTLNDTTFIEATAALARRMSEVDSDLPEEKITHGFLLATSREPKNEEIQQLVELYQTLAANSDLGASAIEDEQTAMQAIASVLLNLDEVLCQ